MVGIHATATQARRCRLEMSKVAFSADVPKCENSQVLWKKYIGLSINIYCIAGLFPVVCPSISP